MSCTADTLISRRKNEPAHYMLKIDSFSLLFKASTSKIESDVFEASGHKWRLDLYPNGNEKEKGGKHISLYLIICDTESLPKGWEVCVDVNFFIYDHNQHIYATFQDIVNGNRTRFNKKKMKCVDELISLDSFKNCENGFLSNDSCVFGAELFAVKEYVQKDRCLSFAKPPPIISTHTWTIDNFSDVTETVLCSENFKVGKVKWKLTIYPKGIGEGVGTHWSFFLRIHDGASFHNGWRVYEKYKLHVKNQSDIPDFEKEHEAWFRDSSDCWGNRHFMRLSVLNDPAKGYLLNGSLIVEAEFSLVGMVNNFI